MRMPAEQKPKISIWGLIPESFDVVAFAGAP